MNSRTVMTAGLVALWAVGLYALFTLPPQVVSHWNNDGTASSDGSKFSVLILPAVALFAYAVIRWTLSQASIQVNVPFDVPPDKLDAVQAVSRRMMAFVGAVLMVGFTCVQVSIVLSSASGTLSPMFLPTIIGFIVTIIGSIVATLVAMWRAAH